MFQTPPLTRKRIWTAYAIAVTADTVQWLFGPIGFAFPDEAIDAAAMAGITWAIGWSAFLFGTLELWVASDVRHESHELTRSPGFRASQPGHAAS